MNDDQKRQKHKNIFFKNFIMLRIKKSDRIKTKENIERTIGNTDKKEIMRMENFNKNHDY